MDAPRLTVRQLGCERDHRMLFENLDFSARNGEIWQVTGANGAGKTTLLRILVGLHGFYQGRVEWSSPLRYIRISQVEGKRDAARRSATLRAAVVSVAWWAVGVGIGGRRGSKRYLDALRKYGSRRGQPAPD